MKEEYGILEPGPLGRGPVELGEYAYLGIRSERVRAGQCAEVVLVPQIRFRPTLLHIVDPEQWLLHGLTVGARLMWRAGEGAAPFDCVLNGLRWAVWPVIGPGVHLRIVAEPINDGPLWGIVHGEAARHG